MLKNTLKIWDPTEDDFFQLNLLKIHEKIG